MAIGLSLASLIMASLQGCGTSGPDPRAQDDYSLKSSELRRGIGGEPESLDPGRADDEFSFEVIRDLYEGLTTEDPDGSVVPGVAESWVISSSGTRYTFKLRPSALWSNGQRVTADQFVAAWRHAVNPKMSSPIADSLRLIAGADDIIKGKEPPETLGVSAPEDDLLIVTLVQPAPFFPQLLAHSATFPIFSANAASTHNPAAWVSNGAYVLEGWIPGSNLKLKKNPNYWGREKVRISRIVYVPVADDSTELRQYKAGELDITHSVPSGELISLQSDRREELHVAPFLGTAYYALNIRPSSFLNDKNLRQALTMAIDRSALQKSVLTFGQKAAYGFVPPETLHYETQTFSWKNLSAEDRNSEARRLFAVFKASEPKPLHLKLLLNSSPNIKRMAVAVASMWKNTLGIDCELIDEEYRVFLDSRKDRSRWDVVRLGWTADYNDATSFLDTFRQFSPNNDSGYSKAQFDNLLNQASFATDQLSRQQLLQKAEAVMLSDYPIIPIYFYSSKRLVKSYVKGVVDNPLNRLLSRNIYLD